MEWKWPGGRFIHSADGRFYISKSMVRGEWVYILADRQELVCAHRGDGARERCQAVAEERAKQ